MECNKRPHGKRKSNCAECTTPCPHGKVKKDCVACTGCRHGKRKRSCTACKSERKGQAGSPQIKQEPETKQKEPEVKPEP